jgi:NTE family protein
MRLMLQWTHYFSPEQLNPFDLNPLRDVLREQLDIEGLRQRSPVRLFIATTEANTGKLRLFRNADLSLDAVLASACLPRLHRSVLIDGQPHWDGGYAANPAVYPLLLETATRDTLLVMLTPLRYAATPQSAQDIEHRMQELAFNATFLREMRMFAHLRERIAHIGWWRRGPLERRLAQSRFHAIEPDALMGELGADSKAAASLKFFEMLFELGRGQGRLWLDRHHGAIGQRGTVDLAALFY